VTGGRQLGEEKEEDKGRKLGELPCGSVGHVLQVVLMTGFV
jgi:hypothetical protein